MTVAGSARSPHVDVLFQAYFVAFLLLGAVGRRGSRNPYVGAQSKMVSGLSETNVGHPHSAARHALNSVWYQKWWIHLRTAPIPAARYVRQILSGFGGTLNGHGMTTFSTRRRAK